MMFIAVYSLFMSRPQVPINFLSDISTTPKSIAVSIEWYTSYNVSRYNRPPNLHKKLTTYHYFLDKKKYCLFFNDFKLLFNKIAKKLK